MNISHLLKMFRDLFERQGFVDDGEYDWVFGFGRPSTDFIRGRINYNHFLSLSYRYDCDCDCFGESLWFVFVVI